VDAARTPHRLAVPGHGPRLGPIAQGALPMPPVERSLEPVSQPVPTSYAPPTSRGSSDWPLIDALLRNGAALPPPLRQKAAAAVAGAGVGNER